MEKAKVEKPSLKSRLIGRLHDPLQLRFALCLGILAAWYFGAYAPVVEQIAATTAKLERDRKRLALATEVEALRLEAAEFEDRLPPRSDPNEFLQYVLAAIRSGPLKMTSLVPDMPRDAGPFQVASIKVELEGECVDVAHFLRWVETDKRMLRIDNLKIDLGQKAPDALKLQVSILGLMGVEAKPDGARARPPTTKGATTKKANPRPPQGRPASTPREGQGEAESLDDLLL